MHKLPPRALEYLNAIARYKTLRKAAARLNVDPSAVSRLLSQLEEKLLLPVWDRTNNHNPITPAGNELLQYYRKMSASEQATLSRIDDLLNLRTGEVRIAVGEGILGDLISSSLQSFLEKHKGIQLSVEMAGAQDAVQLLQEEHIDFALTYASVNNPKLYCHLETSHPLELIVPPGHALTKQQAPVTFHSVAEYPFALLDKSTGMGRLVTLVEELNHLKLTPRLRTNSVAALKNFVMSGLGITFMPLLTVRDEIEQGKIVVIPIKSSILSQAKVQVLSIESRELTLAAQALLSHLSETMAFLAHK
ncbi:LysR family transcriptional regulator [Marinomonas algicola]|jgi:DNA-binding transcriptional LysR family regulator|uniref:LysR family transcriptional regulator n=1 Tax=Marinomonas algicola TaxID=2773454 RepID=UPI0017486DD4|nr:LysR substrate-binding domain-containing protein [Marinomonas algicola]